MLGFDVFVCIPYIAIIIRFPTHSREAPRELLIYWSRLRKGLFFLEIASQFDPLNTCSADTYEWGARLCKLANKNEILKTIRERKHKWVGRTIERRRRKRKGWWRRDSMRKLRPFLSFRWWERGEGEKSQPLTLALWRWLTSFLWDFLSRIFTLYSKGGWVS